MNQQTIEDYLKTIYKLAEVDSPVGTFRLAKTRQVNPASVTKMMKQLSRLGYVNYEKSRGVTLTDEGRSIALETLRHHRLIELYLTQKLGFSWDEVHEEAECLEHVISEKLEERIADVLGHPQFDPHGDPIPSKSGRIIERESVPLASLVKGSRATVLRIMDSSNSELLCYLADLGLMPGSQISVVDVAPFDGPLTLEIENKPQILGHRVAQKIHVQIQTDEG